MRHTRGIKANERQGGRTGDIYPCLVEVFERRCHIGQWSGGMSDDARNEDGTKGLRIVR